MIWIQLDGRTVLKGSHSSERERRRETKSESKRERGERKKTSLRVLLTVLGNIVNYTILEMSTTGPRT